MDVAIVGGRCAGASLAIRLASAGLSVVVLDRGKRGSDKLSTLYIHQPGVEELRGLGVEMNGTIAGAPPIDSLHYFAEGIHIQGHGPMVGGGNVAYAPRRFHLDELLCVKAEEVGAEIIHEARVTNVILDNNRISGLTYRKGGASLTLEARLVVGADGLRSTIASEVQAEKYLERPKATCCYYGFFEGLDAPFSQYQAGRRWVGVIPTAGSHLVACYLPQEEFLMAKADPQAAFEAALLAVNGELHARVTAAHQLDRLIGMGDQQNYYRTAAGPGWVLVGDAGHHKDSLTAQGITDALVQSAVLADELSRVPIDDPNEVDAATKEFGRRRDEESLSRYFSTLAVARLELTGARREMLEAIADRQDLCNLYVSAMAGVTSSEDFYTQLKEEGVLA